MTATLEKNITTEEVKQAILSLIRENNAEFKQFVGDLLPNAPVSTKKKKKQTVQTPTVVFEEKKLVPYSEMPYWKANPDLKPMDATPYSVADVGYTAAEFLKNIKETNKLFSDISDEEWLEQIKD